MSWEWDEANVDPITCNALQWDTVAEYATATDNNALLASALWRLHDWQRLKDIVLPKALVRSILLLLSVHSYQCLYKALPCHTPLLHSLCQAAVLLEWHAFCFF